MKNNHIIISLITLTTFLGACQQKKNNNFSLKWDDNPEKENVKNYIVYEKVGDKLIKLKEVKENQITINDVKPGHHTYTVTAINEKGIESKPAVEVTVKK